MLVVALGSWLLHAVAGAALAGAVPPDKFYLQNPSDVPFGSLNMWARWDGVHYLDLAGTGYANGSPAFFPLYPLLVRMAGTAVGGPLSPAGLGPVAVALSLVLLPVGLWFVHELAEDLAGARAARVAVILLAFFPTSFFLTTAYTESLFLALSAGSLWAVHVRRDLAAACVLAAGATATRNVGVFLMLPLVIEWWRGRETNQGRPRWHAGWLVLAPGGLVAFGGYLWIVRGDPLAFVHEQAKWHRSATEPFDFGSRALSNAGHSATSLLDSGNWQPFGLSRVVVTLSGLEPLNNLLFLLVAIAALVVASRVLPWHLTVYSAVLVLVAVPFGSDTDPLMGLPRYVLVGFPLFIAVAQWMKDRPIATAVVAGSGAVASLPLIALFTNWYFVA